MEKPHFIQITSGKGGLYALDDTGRVWKYFPRTEERYAFWGQLTDHRAKTVEEKG